MRYFIRGGEIIIHQILMWAQVVIKLTIALLLVYALVLAGMFLFKTQGFERHLVWQYWLAQSFLPADAMLVVEWANGDTYSVRADTFLASIDVNHTVMRVWHTFAILARKLAWWFTGLYVVCIGLLAFKGFLQSRSQFIRGSRLISAAILKWHLKSRFQASPITLGGVPLVQAIRRHHVLLIGATGSGKTQGILELLEGFRKENYKVIVLDPECTAVKYFYRDTHDIIINPMDMRANYWDFWKDARNESQLEYIAAALVPEPKSGADPFWNHAARVLFLETAKVVLKERAEHTRDEASKPGIQRLLSLLTTADLKILENALKGTIAESLVSRDAEKLALSVKSTLSAYLRCLELIKDTHPDFSIRDWVHDSNDSWLFITSREDMHETFKPLLSVILDVVANELLTLDENPQRKIALVIDEEASLNPSRSLQEIRARGSKRGVQVVSGYQTPAQAVALSGAASAQALFSMYGTRVYFTCNDAESAKQASHDLGQQEILEVHESVSLGANPIRDGISMTRQRRIIDLVMSDEIMNLPPRKAYMRFSGNYPIAQIEVPVCSLPKRALGFIAKAEENNTLPSPAPSHDSNEHNNDDVTRKTDETSEEAGRDKEDEYVNERF